MIGSDDNFFALGGDSLRGAQITNRVNAMFNCQFDATSLFRRPTVAEFAAEITKALHDCNVSASPPIVALPRGNVMPCSADAPGEG